MRKIILISVLSIIFLTGCEEKEEIKPVSYWDKNKTERTEYIKKCDDGKIDPVTLSCRNSYESRTKEINNNNIDAWMNRVKQRKEKMRSQNKN